MAAATSAAELSPCTFTGQTRTWRGKRSASRCRMSRMTAPVGDVTTPITSGRNGRSCLRASSNRPSAASFFLRSSSSAISAPTPAGSSVSTTIWYFERTGESGEPAGDDDVEALFGLQPHAGERGLPDHRLEHRLVVLEAEIDVAGGRGAAEARNFAAHPDIAIGVLDGAFSAPPRARRRTIPEYWRAARRFRHRFRR